MDDNQELRRSKRARVQNRMIGVPKSAMVFLQVPLRGALYGIPDPETAEVQADLNQADTDDPTDLTTADATVVGAIPAPVPLHQCIICMDAIAEPVLMCSKCDAICSSCETQTIKHAVLDIKASATMAEIGVKCSCCAELITDLSKLQPDSIKELMTAIQLNAGTVKETQVTRQMIADAEQAARDAKAAEYQKHLNAIKTIFKTFCPACGDQYSGFTACCALTCRCKTKFCAFCHYIPVTLDENIHEHVRNCTEHYTPNDRSVYVNADTFKKVQRARMFDKAEKYLEDEVSYSMAKRICEALNIGTPTVIYEMTQEQVEGGAVVEDMEFDMEAVA
jgi:hypothetical protein